MLAQVIIDGCKREYEIVGEDEIKRISKLPCMTMTKETGEYTKNGSNYSLELEFTNRVKMKLRVIYLNEKH